MDGIDALDYDQLTQLETMAKERKTRLESDFKRGDKVLFLPSVQSGKKISVPARIKAISGQKVVIITSGNDDFPTAQCSTSVRKLRPCSADLYVEKYGKESDQSLSFPSTGQFRECSTCGIDARASSCKCMSWDGATTY